MAARPNNPVDKVRELQRTLFRAAKRDPGRRFHALFDRIWRSDVLQEAWKRVRSNGGAAGIDGVSLAMIEQRGVAQFLTGVRDEIRNGRYRPQPVRRVWIRLAWRVAHQRAAWPMTKLRARGLHQLLGTIQYPGSKTA